MGVYLGLQEELAAWLKPQVEALAHGVRFSGKYPNDTPSQLMTAWGCRCNSSGSTCKGLYLELEI